MKTKIEELIVELKNPMKVKSYLSFLISCWLFIKYTLSLFLLSITKVRENSIIEGKEWMWLTTV